MCYTVFILKVYILYKKHFLQINSVNFKGKLDPAKQLLEIMDWKATIPSAEQCAFIGKVLTEWAGHCEALIGDLNTTAESALQQTEQES